METDLQKDFTECKKKQKMQIIYLTGIYEELLQPTREIILKWKKEWVAISLKT